MRSLEAGHSPGFQEDAADEDTSDEDTSDEGDDPVPSERSDPLEDEGVPLRKVSAADDEYRPLGVNTSVEAGFRVVVSSSDSEASVLDASGVWGASGRRSAYDHRERNSSMRRSFSSNERRERDRCRLASKIGWGMKSAGWRCRREGGRGSVSPSRCRGAFAEAVRSAAERGRVWSGRRKMAMGAQARTLSIPSSSVIVHTSMRPPPRVRAPRLPIESAPAVTHSDSATLHVTRSTENGGA